MPPFTVLHVCMGNICRSPMAERLLTAAVVDALSGVVAHRPLSGRSGTRAGARLPDRPGGNPGADTPDLARTAGVSRAKAGELVLSHSTGTGGWHVGEEMHPSAARQVRAMGGDPAGFKARRLRSEHIDAADLVLVATADQQLYVTALRPDATARTFVLGEFGRLLRRVETGTLPPAALTADAVYHRGLVLVAAADSLRGDTSPLPGDDLDDPWGRGEKTFARVAEEIDDVVRPLATVLLPFK